MTKFARIGFSNAHEPRATIGTFTVLRRLTAKRVGG